MMKRNYITLFIIAFSLQLSMSKDLFKVYYPSNETYNLISESYPAINMSLIHDSIVFLQLNLWRPGRAENDIQSGSSHRKMKALQ